MRDDNLDEVAMTPSLPYIGKFRIVLEKKGPRVYVYAYDSWLDGHLGKTPRYWMEHFFDEHDTDMAKSVSEKLADGMHEVLVDFHHEYWREPLDVRWELHNPVSRVIPDEEHEIWNREYDGN